MLLTILGAIKMIDIAKTGAITMARISSPGKDEDDIILARMLEEVTVEDNASETDTLLMFDRAYDTPSFAPKPNRPAVLLPYLP